jgi:hypothetical protein
VVRLFALLLLLSLGSSAFAEDKATTRGFTRLAQNAQLCQQIQQNYAQCKKNWEDMGGGTSGQAGSFKQCMDTYYQAGIAAGCWR